MLINCLSTFFLLLLINNAQLFVLEKTQQGGLIDEQYALADDLYNFLEGIRIRMHMDMTNTMGIPPLDPLALDFLSVNFNEFGLGEAKLNLQNVTVTGLNQFVQHKTKFSLIGLRFALELTIPKLIMIGHFDGSGDLGGFLPLKGSGPFSLEIHNIELNITGQLRYVSSEWSMLHLDADLQIDGLVSEFEGFENGSDFFNEVLTMLGADLLDELWPEIKPDILSGIELMVLEFLNDKTLSELLSFMANPPFPPVEPILPTESTTVV